MSEFSKYPHLENIYKVQNIFLEPEVVVTEKIDGTNMRFGLVDNKFHIGTRNRLLARVSKEEPLYDGDSDFNFVKYLKELNMRNKMFDNFENKDIIFYGEFYGKGIQKRIHYGEERYFRVFDIRVGEDLVDWETVVKLCQQLRLSTVPVLYKGKPDVKLFESLVTSPSVTAGQQGVGTPHNHEGIIIKPASMHRNKHGDWVMAKFKNPAHEERQSKTLKTSIENVIPTNVQEFVDEFVTENRLEHVLSHLKEQGVHIDDITATGQVLKEMSKDVCREGATELEQLNTDWKPIAKLISTKTSILFRQHLIKTLAG